MTFWVPGSQSHSRVSCLCPSHVNLHSGGKHCEIRAGVRAHCLTKLWLRFSAEVHARFLFLSLLWGAAVLLSLTPSPCPTALLLSCLQPCSLPGCVTHTLTLQGLGKAWDSILCTASYLAAWGWHQGRVVPPLRNCHTRREKCWDKRETPGVFIWNPDWIGENAQNCNSSEILF